MPPLPFDLRLYLPDPDHRPLSHWFPRRRVPWIQRFDSWPVRLALRALQGVLTLVAGFFLFTAVTIVQYNWVNPGVTGFMVWRALNGTENRGLEPIPRASIPKRLRRAFVLLEDHQFYKHKGFDLEGIERALKINKRVGRFYAGGSTISQQLARNLFLTPHKNLVRKGLEALITLELELLLPKDRILDLYMNCIEFGPGVYGIGTAARYHYKKSFYKLSIDQMYRLAVIITSPLNYGVWNFGSNPGMIQRYQALLQL